MPLLASIDLAVTIVDLEGTVLEWNHTAERMYQIGRSDIVGKDITGFFAPASLMVRQVLATGRAIDSTYHQPQPGIHVLVTAAPVRNEAGRLVGALAVERDVTRMVELSAELVRARDQVASLEQQLTARARGSDPQEDPFAAIKGGHPATRQAIELARRVARTDATVMIRGESGVGKELFARGIYRASGRGHGPFVALNCSAIPATLFESELFGYAPGAFTGANPRGQAGKLELAGGGTLFLDEVGELPLESQAKLLRFLEERKFFRVGGAAPVSVDVRIVAATNRPLEEMVRQGKFRDDLYWRLNVVTLTLPPLRERKADIPELVQLYIHEFGTRYGRAVSHVDPAVVQALMQHLWPGNIRELRNTVERMVVLAEHGEINPGLLPIALGPALAADPVRAILPDRTTPADAPGDPAGMRKPNAVGLKQGVARSERDQILAALVATGQNRRAAAKLLGISRGTLYNKSRRLGIDLSGLGQTAGEDLPG